MISLFEKHYGSSIHGKRKVKSIPQLTFNTQYIVYKGNAINNIMTQHEKQKCCGFPTKILEFDTCQKYEINLKFGVGGNHKESSSSNLLKRWEEHLNKNTRDSE